MPRHSRSHTDTFELGAVLASIPDGLLITDAQGGLRAVNAVACALLGVRDERQARRALAADESRLVLQDPDGVELPRSEWPLARALNGESVTVQVLRLRHPDAGSRLVRWTAKPVRGPSGDVCMVVHTLHEVDEASASGPRACESEQHLGSALRRAGVAVFHQDRELRYTRVDNFPLPAEDAIGKRGSELLERPGDAQALEAIARRVLDTGAGVRQNIGIQMGGVERRYDVALEPLRDAEGAVVGITGAAVDRTERAQLEAKLLQQAQQLVEADRSKDEYLGMLAHELRNPLAPLHYAVALLHRKHAAPDDPLLRWGLDVIARQVGQITRLLDDLLDVARITRGRVELRKQRTPLARLVFDAVAIVRPSMEARQHDLVISIPPESVELEVDPVRITQVLANLLDNAAKYTPPGGRVEVVVRTDPDAAVIRVCDSGIGIAPETLPHVFELFAQAQRTLDRSQGGLGLGLKLVHSLVGLHGGTATAHSAGIGAGAEFTVRLPLSGAEPHASPPPVPRAGTAPATRRTLIVDDNAEVATSFAALVQALGHEVETAPDGPAALAAARSMRPEVVFLDIGLPGMDGYEVARRLRSEHGARGMLLVAVTGYGLERDRRLAREAGFDDHLLKPVDLESLERVLSAPGP
jgi:signal transduction histidine kinase